jgi:tetratricopeptide (TPR) repeat protein/2-polyprenyl-3-methyl-5-hydroxy-6-metoxy-1,4-benzoquinol methylase
MSSWVAGEPETNGGTATPPQLDQGFAAALRCHQAGELAQADRLYRGVLAIDPNHVESLHHLGIIALQTGRHADARDLIGKALGLNDRIPECHYHIGLALAMLGEMNQAAVHNRRAIELKPDYAEAHLNLGNVLKNQGRPREAAACYELALVSRPDFAEARFNLANVLCDEGRLDAAIGLYREALALRPGYADAHNNLGTALAAKGDLSEAVAHYQQALTLDPRLFDTYSNLASALLANGDAAAALAVVARALSSRETQRIKTRFIECVRALQSFPPAQEFRDLVRRALDEAWGRPGDLAACATALIRQGGNLRACIERAVGAWPQRLPPSDLLAAADLAAIAGDRLLQSLLQSTPVLDIGLERLLTSMRAALLEKAAAAGSGADLAPSEVGLWCALARQCFINEYVFDFPQPEWQQARRLGDALAAAAASSSQIPVLWPVAVAAYLPLHSVAGAQALLDRHWPEPVSELLVQQVREPAEEYRIRASLAALTTIEDQVSLMVRRQYEENPYPRWVRLPPESEPAPFDQYVRRQFPLAVYRPLGRSSVEVLIAGCGTGRHSIAVAQALVGAQVLAIDLSLSSLSYAKRKTTERGLRNIDYMQADILKLGSIGRKFDFIDSTGVLHHLADPWAAWRVLLSLLAPAGCMRIGLYSALARRDVKATMAYIAERGYGASADDIRRCRQELMNFAPGTPQRNVATSADFFSTSDCRDLLFHVQEQGVTIPAIKAFLKANELEFLGFELDARVLRRYALRFPEDPARSSLDAWHVFETENPYTFSDMYVLMVQKRS